MDFYTQGKLAACAVFGLYPRTKQSGVSVPTPYRETYQRQAMNLPPTGAKDEIDGTWDVFDQRVERGVLPPTDDITDMPST